MTAIAATVPVDVEITDTSWTPQGHMTFEDWAHAGANLQRMGRAINFWIGDWLLYGERNYGETYAQAIDMTGLDYQTLANVASVARRVEPSRRRETLSWSHHEAVAALPAPEQDEWLQRAEEEGMTRNRLRSRLGGTPKDAPDPDQQLAATHMGQIRFRLVAESDEDARDRVHALAALLERRGVTVTHEKADALA